MRQERELVLVALGSNIRPRDHVPRAVGILDRLFGLEAVSSVYESPPVGDPEGPIFWNAAVSLTSSLGPDRLRLEVLRPLETSLGRERCSDPNAPRTIDLDIALYGDRIVRDGGGAIRIPDPDVLARAHVAVPLAEVAPERRHPLTGETLEAIAERVGAGSRLLRRPLPVPLAGGGGGGGKQCGSGPRR